MPEQAELVHWIFERAATGALPKAIADEANARGGFARRWNQRGLVRMLQNPVYIGRHPDGAPSTHPRIVDQQVFDQVQASIVSRRTHESRPQVRLSGRADPFVLRGLLRCPRCKGTMTTASAVPVSKLKESTPRYYLCHAQGCKGMHLPAREVEARAARFLVRLPEKWDAAIRERAVGAALVWNDLFPQFRRAAFTATFESLTWHPTLYRFTARPVQI